MSQGSEFAFAPRSYGQNFVHTGDKQKLYNHNFYYLTYLLHIYLLITGTVMPHEVILQIRYNNTIVTFLLIFVSGEVISPVGILC